MRLRVEYSYDHESHNWCFVVPSLQIIGGAATREDAEQRAMETIDFTIESQNEAPLSLQSEVSYLQLTVRR
ncbi:MAG: hypothetical protein ACR2PL_28400 [Dehalococcoidia bacterium]